MNIQVVQWRIVQERTCEQEEGRSTEKGIEGSRLKNNGRGREQDDQGEERGTGKKLEV